jgi:AcrR family transcriptional regulator
MNCQFLWLAVSHTATLAGMATDGTGDAPRPPGLRLRKAARARQQYAATARQLFRERGYEATSLDDIAGAAETSVSTLVRYFGSKERLALANRIEALERFRAMAAADGPTPTIERWRTFVAELASDGDYSPQRWAEERELITSEPAISRLSSHIQRSYQDVLAEAFAREAGVDPADDLYGQLLAALLVAGNEAVFRRWLAKGDGRDLVATIVAVVDFAASRLGTRDNDDPTSCWLEASPIR